MNLYLIVVATVIGITSADVNTLTGYRTTPAGSYLPPRDVVGGHGGHTEVLADNYVPKVYKHVYVHSAPDDEPQQAKRVIRVNGGDKHVNLIFVKAPSQSSHAQTEVILPQQDEQKNLVYVLLKKNEASDNIKIVRPQPTAPAKPEVHFIRYADAFPQENQVHNEAQAVAPVPPPPAKPSGLYETPSGNQRYSSSSQSAPGSSRVFGTAADVPPFVRQPSGLYGAPAQ